MIPTVIALARDMLGALEHAHSRASSIRRIVPATVLVGPSGRSTVTDLRFSSYTMPAIPASERPTGLNFMAPEIRGGAAGDPACDVYTAGALLYFAVTGQEPPLDTARRSPPHRAAPDLSPRARADDPPRAPAGAPEDRYLTAGEMLEDLASDVGNVRDARASR